MCCENNFKKMILWRNRFSGDSGMEKKNRLVKNKIEVVKWRKHIAEGVSFI